MELKTHLELQLSATGSLDLPDIIPSVKNV